ncbi:MAG: chemotaxis protein CheA [Bacillota bacterium]
MSNGIDNNMLDMYLFETNSLLEQLEEIMLEAEKAKSFSTDNINEIFRIMHTIKGSSAMMEFGSLAKLAHRIEDLFFLIRKDNSVDKFSQETRTELFDLMFRSNDCMKIEVEKMEDGDYDGSSSPELESLVSDINTFVEKISGEGPATPAAPKTEAAATAEAPAPEGETLEDVGYLPPTTAPYILKIIFDAGCGMENLRAVMIQTSLRDEGVIDVAYYPSDVETNPESMDFIVENGFFVLMDDDAYTEKVQAIVSEAMNVESFQLIHRPVEIEPAPETSATTPASAEIPQPDTPKPVAPKAPAPQAQAEPAHTQAPVKQSIISVNLSKLDSLMAIVGEIVITESMVTASPDLKGLRLDNFTKSARQLRKLTDELQDITMSIRMIPISGVFTKMNRIVRDMSQKLGKDVKLTIIGENTELDKTIVDSINDPLMHIVRNSMDHGIEANVEDRLSLGKPAQGEIVLEAEHMGSDIIITVTDDGKGIDPDKILMKARKNGILTKPEGDYTKKEILSLILSAGFSTNEQVTEFSGRGVGMDVVKQNIEKVGGIVSIESELGEGSCMTLKIPLTLAIVDGMEVCVGKSTFTIPIINIRQSFKVTAGQTTIDSIGNEIVEVMGDFYPIVRLHELYGIQTEITEISEGILVWVESSEKSYCLFVDELIGEQQVVVKPVPKYLSFFNIKDIGIAGCTILGDGNISIILDIFNLHTASIHTH